QRDSLKTTWMHPRSKHWYLILVRQRNVHDRHTCMMPNAEYQTAHRIVRYKLNFRFKSKPER
ncbi:hypothetical protein LOAG_15535, partial [Loa loa]